MDKYSTALNKTESESKKNDNRMYLWQNAGQNEDCSNLTVARDLSISVMTIFEIDSIEMKEGFIY